MTATQQAMDTLYREAVALSDAARGWFDGPGREWRGQLAPEARAIVATEGLAVTSRLMAVMCWLLDPAHVAPGAMAPAFVAETGADRPVPPVLAGTPGGDIALASRQLAARCAALASGDYPGDQTP